MAERPEEERITPRIVPDADASFGSHPPPRQRHAPSPRVWPLWCLLLIVLLTMSGFGYVGWQVYQTLQRDINALEGQLSNIHARFDSVDETRTTGLDDIEDQLESLTNEQQTFTSRLDDQQDRLDTVEGNEDDQERLAELTQRLESMDEDYQTLSDIVAATRESLNALEQAGEDSRATLESRQADNTERLDAWQERLDQWEDRQTAQDVLVSSLMTSVRSLEERLGSLEDSRETGQQSLSELQQQVEDNQDQLRELRQSQLALNAQLEALQGQ
ncbi:uroporphyrinogen-III C-methyltransferase [Aidingimonas lacisalsi]|uniref:uroporphyrinogen-III C-methyltransferase n=1 Tax=Aidingimonas lacisalsi TaxID=2604086 RepID=UPI0011D19F96|nr:uroporphyrinogen-III C-methyltransferase [Aidingimonas lacisalsi]